MSLAYQMHHQHTFPLSMVSFKPAEQKVSIMQLKLSREDADSASPILKNTSSTFPFLQMRIKMLSMSSPLKSVHPSQGKLIKFDDLFAMDFNKYSSSFSFVIVRSIAHIKTLGLVQLTQKFIVFKTFMKLCNKMYLRNLTDKLSKSFCFSFNKHCTAIDSVGFEMYLD